MSKSDSELAEELRQRPSPSRMALSCLWDEIDELISLNSRSPGPDLDSQIGVRFGEIYTALERRLEPRYPDCPNCRSPLQYDRFGTLHCESCYEGLPEDVKEEYRREYKRVWGGRGHGGSARDD